MVRAGVLAIILAALAAPAAAQGWDTFPAARDAPIRGGRTCGIDPRLGNYCLVVGCTPGQSLRIYAVAPALVGQPRRRATLRVDGGAVGQILFERLDPVGGLFAAVPDRGGMTRVLGALRSGNLYTLEFDGSAPVGFGGSLAGSSAALDAAETACPMPQPPAITEPEARARAEVAAGCAAIGATTAFSGPMAQRIDLDGAGPMDLKIDYGAASCTGHASLHCGSAGCRQILYLARPDGSYHPLLDTHFYQVEVSPEGHLRLAVHGSSCGRVGAAGCTLVYRIDAGELTLLRKE